MKNNKLATKLKTNKLICHFYLKNVKRKNTEKQIKFLEKTIWKIKICTNLKPDNENNNSNRTALSNWIYTHMNWIKKVSFKYQLKWKENVHHLTICVRSIVHLHVFVVAPNEKSKNTEKKKFIILMQTCLFCRSF